MTVPLSRPPKDLNSFLGRKWLEALVRQSSIVADFDTFGDGDFVLIAPDPMFVSARVLAVDATLTLTDGGAGSSVTLALNLNKANTWLQDQSVPDEAYGAGWNGSLEVPTKNALYDKIETIISGAGSSSLLRPFFFGGM